jgi:hypothetical protein
MDHDADEDTFTLIKSQAPDPTKPISAVRQEFFAFYREVQQEAGKTPCMERVVISGNGVQGFWIPVPRQQMYS